MRDKGQDSLDQEAYPGADTDQGPGATLIYLSNGDNDSGDLPKMAEVDSRSQWHLLLVGGLMALIWDWVYFFTSNKFVCNSI